MNSRLIAGALHNAKSEKDIDKNLEFIYDAYLDLGDGESYIGRHKPLLQAANALKEPQFYLKDKKEILLTIKSKCLKEIQSIMPNTNTYATRVVTPGDVRFSYVNLTKPRANNFGGEPKFSAVLLIPKNDTNTKAALDAAVNAAIQKGKAEKWNNVIPPRLRTPIKDGDGVKESDGLPYGPECKGHWVLSVSSGENYPPKIVGPDLQPIMDATEVYSGMYGRIAINFSPYNSNGNKGVGAYISTNVMKTGDGEPLGASAPDAGSDFGAPGAPLNNGASVWNGIPDAGQQAPQQTPAYGQTAQPASPYPNYGQQPQGQRINPLTGQPM